MIALLKYSCTVFYTLSIYSGIVLPEGAYKCSSVFISICRSAPAANGLSTISHEYLKGSYALDLEAVKQGACSLPHLNKTLVASCKRLNGYEGHNSSSVDTLIP